MKWYKVSTIILSGVLGLFFCQNPLAQGQAVPRGENFDSGFSLGEINGQKNWLSNGGQIENTKIFTLPFSLGLGSSLIASDSFSSSTATSTISFYFYLNDYYDSIPHHELYLLGSSTDIDRIAIRFVWLNLGGTEKICLMILSGGNALCNSESAGAVPMASGWYKVEIQWQNDIYGRKQNRYKLGGGAWSPFADSWADFSYIDSLIFVNSSSKKIYFDSISYITTYLSPFYPINKYPLTGNASTTPMTLCEGISPSSATDIMGGIQWGLCNVAQWLFVPDDVSVDNFQSLTVSFRQKTPFAYLYTVVDALSGLSGSSTPAFYLSASSTGALNTSIFSPIKTGLNWILWIMFGVFCIKRIGKFDF
jgi:hypothetical protein